MLWKIKSAIRIAFQRLRRPLRRIHSYSWGLHDHAHACMAARLLEEDDFRQVCPACHKAGFEAEHDEMCDECPLMAIIEFNKTTDEVKWISICCDLAKDKTNF